VGKYEDIIAHPLFPNKPSGVDIESFFSTIRTLFA
jgi:hypothetical protein